MTENAIRSLLSVVAAAITSSTIVVDGVTVAPLLPKTVEDLLGFWNAGLSAIAVRDGRVIGHAAIEPLCDGWFELGAVWVDPSVRGAEGKHSHVGLRLYRALLAAHREKNILATTINPAAMTVGWRVGMVPILYEQLPQEVWAATCCCPAGKTGVPRSENVPHCALKQKICFVRITSETWTRLGCPEPCRLPVGKPTEPALVVNDDIVILLAE